MPSSSLAKNSESKAKKRGTAGAASAKKGRKGAGRATAAKKKTLSSSKALVPAGQVELSSRERLAKKRQANAAVAKTRSRRTTVKAKPRGRKRGAAVVKRASVPMIERPWFRPMVRTIHEGLLLLTSALIVYITLSLVTYHATDPGFSQVGLNDEIHNMGGQAGAWMASVLYSLLGYGAFWVPLLLIYGIHLLFMMGRRPWSGLLACLRCVGLVAILLSGTTLAALHISSASLPMSAGGILGLEIVRELTPLFNQLGISLLASVVLLTGISMVCDLSWSNVAGWVGRQAITLVGRSRDGFVGLWHYIQEERHYDVDEWGAEGDLPVEPCEEGKSAKGRGKGKNKDKDKGRGTIESADHDAMAVGTSLESGKDLVDRAAEGVPLALLQGLEKLKSTKERFFATLRDRQAQKRQAHEQASRREEPVWEGDPSDERRFAGASSDVPVIVDADLNTEAGMDQNAAAIGGDLKACTLTQEGGEPRPEKSLNIGKRADQEVQGSARRPAKQKQKSLFNREVMGDLPPIELLDPVEEGGQQGFSDEALKNMSRLLELKLRDFNIEAEVEAVIPGPVVTRFEIQLAPGIKVMRITNLAKDLARSLAVISVRVVEVIPGKTTVGIEIPNTHREVIRLSEVVASEGYERSKSPLTLCLGKDISGHSVSVDLAKMPHLLVAGTTGSGKSVGLNAMLISMLFKSTPEQLRMIMIDPKMLELSVYDDIPHLLSPVVTDMKEAANALRWCVAEMERRYRLMAAMGVRNLTGFNRKVDEAIKAGNPLSDPLWRPVEVNESAPKLGALPNIVVVIDEFADMMMIVGKKVEELIARIAQKARAAGIHLILATQRPSVDVITGLIKANVPSRIAFQVSSKVDSRTILDQGGAEQLLGSGDMLYLPPGTALPQRVHGAFVSDDEVHRVCDDWRQRGDPDYLDEVLEGTHESGAAPGFEAEKSADDPEADPLYDEAVKFVTQTRKASISSVQRKLKIGYNRAARMIDSMEAAGVVSPMQNNGAREVIAPPPV